MVNGNVTVFVHFVVLVAVFIPVSEDGSLFAETDMHWWAFSSCERRRDTVFRN